MKTVVEIHSTGAAAISGEGIIFHAHSIVWIGDHFELVDRKGKWIGYLSENIEWKRG